MQHVFVGLTLRCSRIALLAALAFAAPGMAGVSDTAQEKPAPARGFPDDRIAPLSLSMMQSGETLLAKGQIVSAAEQFESALAADPRNRRAYLGLARAAEAEGLHGKAVRYYREALEIEPNDIDALELQGLAMIERGAKARAEGNVERMRKICQDAACPQADRLASAIATGPRKVATAVVTPKED